jgi:hypothetical protein
MDFVKDVVGQDFALCKRKGCGLKFAVLLDSDGKVVKFWRNEPDGRNELPDKEELAL